MSSFSKSSVFLDQNAPSQPSECVFKWKHVSVDTTWALRQISHLSTAYPSLAPYLMWFWWQAGWYLAFTFDAFMNEHICFASMSVYPQVHMSESLEAQVSLSDMQMSSCVLTSMLCSLWHFWSRSIKATWRVHTEAEKESTGGELQQPLVSLLQPQRQDY